MFREEISSSDLIFVFYILIMFFGCYSHKITQVITNKILQAKINKNGLMKSHKKTNHIHMVAETTTIETIEITEITTEIVRIDPIIIETIAKVA